MTPNELAVVEVFGLGLLTIGLMVLSIWIRFSIRRNDGPMVIELSKFSFTNWMNAHPTNSNRLKLESRDTVFYVYVFDDFTILETRSRSDLIIAKGLLFAVRTDLSGNTLRLDNNAPILPQMAYTYPEV